MRGLPTVGRSLEDIAQPVDARSMGLVDLSMQCRISSTNVTEPPAGRPGMVLRLDLITELSVCAPRSSVSRCSLALFMGHARGPAGARPACTESLCRAWSSWDDTACMPSPELPRAVPNKRCRAGCNPSPACHDLPQRAAGIAPSWSQTHFSTLQQDNINRWCSP